jgi:hypothetical protein
MTTKLVKREPVGGQNKIPQVALAIDVGNPLASE